MTKIWPCGGEGGGLRTRTGADEVSRAVPRAFTREENKVVAWKRVTK